MGYLFFAPIYAAILAVIGLISVLVISGIYQLIKLAIVAIYDDICDVREALKPIEQAPSQPETVTETAPPPTATGTNVIHIDTIAAMAHIRNHEAMQFVKKN